MKKIFVVLFVLVLIFFVTKTAYAKTIQGEAEDPSYPSQLGLIKYLGNPSGYHFWFTPTVNLGSYTAGHAYHNVYKFDLKDTTDWCGPAIVPNREPYNSVADVGAQVYYKIYDVTMDTYVCGME